MEEKDSYGRHSHGKKKILMEEDTFLEDFHRRYSLTYSFFFKTDFNCYTTSLRTSRVSLVLHCIIFNFLQNHTSVVSKQKTKKNDVKM